MEQYIPKATVVAEIEKIIPSEPFPRTSETLYGAEIYGKREICFKILDLIDTLEVKEVDLKKEINAYMDNELRFLSDEVGYDTFSTIAKHFLSLD